MLSTLVLFDEMSFFIALWTWGRILHSMQLFTFCEYLLASWESTEFFLSTNALECFLVFVFLHNEKLQSTTTKSRNRKIQGTRIVGVRGRWPQKGGTGINSFPGLPQVMINATGTHPSVLKSNWSTHLHLLFRATYCMRSWPYKNHWHQFLCINEPFMYSCDVEHTCRIWQIIFDKAHTQHSKIIEGKYCHHHQTNKKTVTCFVFHQPRLKQEIPQWHSFAGPLLLPSDFDFAIGNKPRCQGKSSFDKNTLLPNLNSKRYAFQCFLSSGAACAPYVGCDFRISNLSYHFCVFFPGKTEH